MRAGKGRAGGAPTALPAEPALQVLKAPFSHRSIHLEWQVETGAAFAAGSPLYALRHAGEEALPLFAETLVFGLSLGAVRLSGIGRPHDGVSAEAGILVWRSPGGWRQLTAGEPLGTYVPLSDWQAFTELLDRHAEEIARRRLRDGGGQGEGRSPSLAGADTLSEARARLQALHQEQAAIVRELSEARTKAASKRVQTGPQPLPAASLDALLEQALGLCDEGEAARAAWRAERGQTLADYTEAVLSCLARAFPVPPEDLLPVLPDAGIISDMAASLAMFDALIQKTLSDPELSEEEREEQLSRWQTMRLQLTDRLS